jgi:hypothetical protein
MITLWCIVVMLGSVCTFAYILYHSASDRVDRALSESQRESLPTPSKPLLVEEKVPYQIGDWMKVDN